MRIGLAWVSMPVHLLQSTKIATFRAGMVHAFMQLDHWLGTARSPGSGCTVLSEKKVAALHLLSSLTGSQTFITIMTDVAPPEGERWISH